MSPEMRKMREVKKKFKPRLQSRILWVLFKFRPKRRKCAIHGMFLLTSMQIMKVLVSVPFPGGKGVGFSVLRFEFSVFENCSFYDYFAECEIGVK